MFDKNFKKPEQPAANPLQEANLTEQQTPLSPDTPFRERLQARGHVRPVTTLAIQSGSESRNAPVNAGNDNARQTVSPRLRTSPRRASATPPLERPAERSITRAAPIVSAGNVQADLPPAETLVPKIPAPTMPAHSEPPILHPPGVSEPHRKTVAKKSREKKQRRPLMYGPPRGMVAEQSSSKLQVFAAAGIAAVGAAGLSVLAANYLLAGSAPTNTVTANAGGAGAPPTLPVAAATDTSAAALMTAAVTAEEMVADENTGATDTATGIPDLSNVLAALAEDAADLNTADIAATDSSEVPDETANTSVSLAEAPASSDESSLDMLIADNNSEDLPMGGPDTSIDTSIVEAEMGVGASLVETSIASSESGSPGEVSTSAPAADTSKITDAVASRPSLKPEAPRRLASLALPNDSAKPTRRSLPSNRYKMDAARVKRLSGAIIDSPRTADEFMAQRVLRGAETDIDADRLEAFREDFLKMIAAAEDGATIGGHTPDGRVMSITIEQSRAATQSLPTVRTIDYSTNGYTEVLRFYSEAAPVKVNIMCRDIAYAIPGHESGRFAACKTTQGEWTLARASDQPVRPTYT